MSLTSEQPDKVLEKIETFLAKHHVLMLATSRENLPQTCTLFYAYRSEDVCFVVASDAKTEHIQNVLANPHIAGTVALEAKTVGKIEGLQFKGVMETVTDKKIQKSYFNAFPYARALNPTLWVIRPETMKLTDNRLGFGKKLTWSRDASA